MSNILDLFKKKELKCNENHNPNDIDNSLEMLPNRNMTYPQVFLFRCYKCGKILKYIKEDEIFKIVKTKNKK
jgi:uncharacterized protein CbrC (UPF0167 family)